MHFAHGKSASISDIWGLCTMSMSSRIHGKVTQPKLVAVAGLHLPYREQETEPAVLVPVRGSKQCGKRGEREPGCTWRVVLLTCILRTVSNWYAELPTNMEITVTASSNDR